MTYMQSWKSHRLTSHTWLGLNPQIRRPLSRIVGAIGFLFSVGMFSGTFTVKTGVSFRHSLRHRNSASASVVSTLKSVCLSGKTTLISVKTTLLSVKTTLPLSYRVLEMTLLSAKIKSHSKVSKRHSKSHFQHSIR
jgi:hypothetical protein